MLDQLMGNMEQSQEALRQKLGSITIEQTSGDGAVTATINGNGEITNLAIDDEKLELSDTEQLEDLVIIAVNKAIVAAKELEKTETTKQMKEMLPPGFGNLFGS